MKSTAWLALLPSLLMAQPFNYDEAKVPKFTLPDPLKMVDGMVVKTVNDWETKRRPEVLALFEKEVYGKAPGKPAKLSFAVLEQSKNVLGGTADRKQVQVRFAGTADGPRMTMLIYSPAKAKHAVPAFLTLNFRGNHTVHDDPAILLPPNSTGACPSAWRSLLDLEHDICYNASNHWSACPS